MTVSQAGHEESLTMYAMQSAGDVSRGSPSSSRIFRNALRLRLPLVLGFTSLAGTAAARAATAGARDRSSSIISCRGQNTIGVVEKFGHWLLDSQRE